MAKGFLLFLFARMLVGVSWKDLSVVVLLFDLFKQISSRTLRQIELASEVSDNGIGVVVFEHVEVFAAIAVDLDADWANKAPFLTYWGSVAVLHHILIWLIFHRVCSVSGWLAVVVIGFLWRVVLVWNHTGWLHLPRIHRSTHLTLYWLFDFCLVSQRWNNFDIWRLDRWSSRVLLHSCALLRKGSFQAVWWPLLTVIRQILELFVQQLNLLWIYSESLPIN